jgi:HD-like signal output (HDOD) protein
MNTVYTGDLQTRLSQFSNLPSIPQTILQIREVSADPKATAVDLANCILSDHQLTSRILKMANSAYYGDYAGKITTVTQGIVVMGFRAVHHIAVSMALYGVVNDISRHSRFDMTAFWTRSLASGVIAKFLTHRLNRASIMETAFIAGFLHDIGQVILASVFPDKYETIAGLDPLSPEVCETERILLGIDHLQAGKFVAKKWNMPSRLARPLYEHHRIGRPPGQKSEDLLVDLVYLSDRLYPFVMSEDDPEETEFAVIVNEAYQLANVGKDDLAQLLIQCRQQVTEIAHDLEINIEGQIEKRQPAEADINLMHQQLNNKEVQLAFLQNATSALRQAKSEDEILQVVCEAVFRGMQMGRVLLFERGSDAPSFVGRIGFGVPTQEEVRALRFDSESSLFRHLGETGQPLSVMGNNREAYGSVLDNNFVEKLQLESFAAIPLVVLDYLEFVILADPTDRGEPIDDELFRSMVSLANQGAMSLERLRLTRQLQQR